MRDLEEFSSLPHQGFKDLTLMEKCKMKGRFFRLFIVPQR
jgi:hypothetical protein